MLRTAIFLILLSSQFFPVYAQSIPEDGMETVVVSAARTPVSAELSGSSFTIIDREVLEQRQLSTLSEILRDVPGFAVNRGGVTGSTTQIRVRGSEGNQVLVFIDGIEVNDLSQGSEFNFAHLSASEIERAEIVRGPQSALWGSDALGGVINITTRRGKGPVKITGFAEAGSFATMHGGGSISGGGDNYHFNVAGSYLRSNGDNISRDNDEDDGYKNGSVTLSAGYSPFTMLSFDIVSRFTEATNEFDETDFFITGLPADSDSETAVSQNYSRLQAKLSLYDGSWEHKAGIALSNTDNDNFSNGIENSSTQGKKYKFDYQTSVFLETSGLANLTHALTFAVEHEIEKFTQRGSISFGNNPNQDLRTDSTSYIGEYRVTLAENISLSGSIRSDNNSDYQNATTYRTTAAYFLDEQGLRIHASYGTGIKNPTFTERFGFFASSLFSAFVGNPDLKPEKSRGWEVGFDKSFSDQKVSIGLTYFNEKLADEINGFFFDLATFTTTAINETGNSKRQGIEFTAHAMLSGNLSLSGNYTYLDAKQPDAIGGSEREVRRPEHIANANLNYDFLNNKANINLNVNYNGRQDDVFFAPPFFLQETVSLDSFTLLNIASSYKYSDLITLYGRVENLLDEQYEEVLGFQSMGLAVFAGIKINVSP
jgi:vitamin B12 transporter